MGIDSGYKDFIQELVQRQFNRVPNTTSKKKQARFLSIVVKNSGFRYLSLIPGTATNWLYDSGQTT